MRKITWCLVGGLAVLVAGCGDSEASVPPPCADVSWIRDDQALLTGPPTFSASQIAAGDPLTIAVPVDENTRSVNVGIFATDETIITASGADTDGGETVEFPLENTNLPAGLYLAGLVVLNGDDSRQSARYDSRDPDTPYVLGVSPQTPLTCTTEILAPTFAVVSESSKGP